MNNSNKLFSIVNELLEQYVRGEIFFDKLDAAVKFDIDILNDCYKMACNLCIVRGFDMSKTKFIASGENGLCLHNFGLEVDIITKGGLRKDPLNLNLSPFASKIAGFDFIFIDDSYFSGKTYFAIKKEIERLGGRVSYACVVYDGSHEKLPFVHSLYRYYDHYNILGEEI